MCLRLRFIADRPPRNLCLPPTKPLIIPAPEIADKPHRSSYMPAIVSRSNFSLTPSPSLSIRGSVVNLPPGSSAAIMLQSRDFNLVLNGAEVHKDGSFEIRDVSPGAYTILATLDNVAVPMIGAAIAADCGKR